VRMAVADSGELAALGGAAGDVRSTGSNFSSAVVARPRDGSLLKERSDPHVYLYQGGSPFWIPDPTWLGRFGGWSATRTVPDASLNAFLGPPDEGTLLREWSDSKVYRIMSGHRRWVTTPDELSKYGGFPSVRVVPDGALGSIPIGDPLPAPTPGECAALRQQIKDFDTLIATLEKQLDNLDNPPREAAIRAQISTATRERAQASVRATVLQCPQ